MLKTLLPLFLSTLICVFCAEFISNIWIKKNGDALQRALMVLGPDKQLGWNQKPNLQTTFEGKKSKFYPISRMGVWLILRITMTV
jgi:hypothetical protein